MLLRVLFSVLAGLALASAITAPPDHAKIAPRFAVNLDLPPKQRWKVVSLAFADDFKRLLAMVKRYVPSEALDLLGVVGLKVDTAFPYPYNYEIMGIAENIEGVNMGDVILGNTLYEITAFNHGKEGWFKACTSIVAESLNGTIVHGRNLDYSIGSLLRNLTITVDFQRGGKTVYTGTTYAGYIGLLTGQRPYGFTITLNERDKGQVWMNALEALANGMGAVSSLHIRDALANEEFDYEKALVFLADKPLIAPCYIIIGGVKSSQGAVITRDRIAVLDFMKMKAEKGEWFVLETNYDHWTTPPPDDDRRDPGIKYMNEMGRGNVSQAGLFNVLSTAPVLNERTTYTVVMSAAHPERYTTWIRNIPA
jgi:N-acylethanolamine-hydrolysing acid amidase